jgi:predicted transcriptional regulator
MSEAASRLRTHLRRPVPDRVALMSVHPVYAEALVDGRKTVEFRKCLIAPDIRTVLVYATNPTKKVIGEFEVERVVTGTPEDIWTQFGARGLITAADFARYYAGRVRAVAILVDSYRRFANPVGLRQMNPVPAVPQNFSYLQGDTSNL